MRILVAACGGEGHLGPLLPFVDAARELGDDVLLVVPPAQEATATSTGCIYELTDAPDGHDISNVRRAMESSVRSVRVRAAEVDLFGRLHTQAALPTMERAFARFGPDLVLREPCDYASAVIAHREGVRTAQVGISPGRADVSGLRLASKVVEPLAPGVTTAVASAPYLTRFPGVEDTGFADTRRYGFGPVVGAHRSQEPPLVWLTMGTVNTGFDHIRGTWDAALDAVSTLPVAVVASTGRGVPWLSAPQNVDVVEWVEMSDVLSGASAVLCHGGSGTTLAALAAGVPVVSIPMLADQPTNAAMVQNLGAGIAVSPASGDTIRGLSSSDVPRLRAALVEVLEDPSYSASAQRIASAYASATSVRDSLDDLRSPGAT